MHDLKASLTPQRLCEGICPELEGFISEVFSLDFADTPNYKSLRNTLKELYRNEGKEAGRESAVVPQKKLSGIRKSRSTGRKSEISLNSSAISSASSQPSEKTEGNQSIVESEGRVS